MHHHELLSKIWKIGITGNLWKWFREYLNNRVQHVSINGSNSSILPVLSEAFSGLFYTYYSSMTFLSMYCTPYHYCSQMTPNVCPPYHLLLTVNFYNLTSNWNSEWKLLFNETKCSLLSFSSNNYSSSNLFPYYINNCKIISRTHHKDLGIQWRSQSSAITGALGGRGHVLSQGEL